LCERYEVGACGHVPVRDDIAAAAQHLCNAHIDKGLTKLLVHLVETNAQTNTSEDSKNKKKRKKKNTAFSED
jgi:hypothetical protein